MPLAGKAKFAFSVAGSGVNEYLRTGSKTVARVTIVFAGKVAAPDSHAAEGLVFAQRPILPSYKGRRDANRGTLFGGETRGCRLGRWLP